MGYIYLTSELMSLCECIRHDFFRTLSFLGYLLEKFILVGEIAEELEGYDESKHLQMCRDVK